MTAMKIKLLFISLMLFLSASVSAQNAAKAKRILDKTAATVGRKGGASANFTISGAKIGSTSGTIAIKGRKFHARTSQTIVWFDGVTQWAYVKRNNEVNISTPSDAQKMSMNPYGFINIYRSGYRLSMTNAGKNYKIHLKASNGKQAIQEMYIIINRSYQPVQIKMLQKGDWTTINISNFRAKNQSDSFFRFNAKDFPKAEVIDLR